MPSHSNWHATLLRSGLESDLAYIAFALLAGEIAVAASRDEVGRSRSMDCQCGAELTISLRLCDIAGMLIECEAVPCGGTGSKIFSQRMQTFEHDFKNV